MNRLKIKLSTPEMVCDFINVCSKYDCDINVYDESNVLDGKSIVGVFAITQGKQVETEAKIIIISVFWQKMRKAESGLLFTVV